MKTLHIKSLQNDLEILSKALVEAAKVGIQKHGVYQVFGPRADSTFKISKNKTPVNNKESLAYAVRAPAWKAGDWRKLVGVRGLPPAPIL